MKKKYATIKHISMKKFRYGKENVLYSTAYLLTTWSSLVYFYYLKKVASFLFLYFASTLGLKPLGLCEQEVNKVN